ncbi:MAG: hypothetical protein P8P82_05190 [Flavobacteriales bacterium]|jgi:hypothetical protein|nr:hypothetical protein [Flavobacteriales bacterium]MDG2086998.1 hypothetical protein [Flavobacteriales bacterium]|tara:strand:+ start:2406 stop:2819 length:414 start_codon:yes stop_codon:yes gene_type:complete
MRVALFLSIVFFMTSCDKDPGEGGTSSINGEVYKIFTFQNPNTGNWDTSYYQLDAGKDVFIIYSDNQSEIYDDKFETDYNGRYHFEYLRNGNYTIYTYADSTDASNIRYDYPVFRNIKITSSNSIMTAKDFVIEENQ